MPGSGLGETRGAMVDSVAGVCHMFSTGAGDGGVGVMKNPWPADPSVLLWVRSPRPWETGLVGGGSPRAGASHPGQHFSAPSLLTFGAAVELSRTLTNVGGCPWSPTLHGEQPPAPAVTPDLVECPWVAKSPQLRTTRPRRPPLCIHPMFDHLVG